MHANDKKINRFQPKSRRKRFHSFCQTLAVTWQKSTFTPPRPLDSNDDLLILELNDLEYLLKHLLWFLLFLKGCGVGDGLGKFTDEVLFC